MLSSELLQRLSTEPRNLPVHWDHVLVLVMVVKWTHSTTAHSCLAALQSPRLRAGTSKGVGGSVASPKPPVLC